MILDWIMFQTRISVTGPGRESIWSDLFFLSNSSAIRKFASTSPRRQTAVDMTFSTVEMTEFSTKCFFHWTFHYTETVVKITKIKMDVFIRDFLKAAYRTTFKTTTATSIYNIFVLWLTQINVIYLAFECLYWIGKFFIYLLWLFFLSFAAQSATICLQFH